jgi:GT2 family glycosyltransferase
MDAHPETGVCTAQNYNENNEPVRSFDQYKDFWRLLLGRGFLEKYNPKKYPRHKGTYTQPLTVNWVNGCFLFFRAEAFSEIGGFDTNIFLYFEEMDLCKRLEKKNYKSVLVPEAKILHYVSKSSGYSKRINKEAFLSHMYVLKKHYSNLHYRSVQLYYLFTFLFKSKKWYLLPLAWRGANLTRSIKHEQQIRMINEENV